VAKDKKSPVQKLQDAIDKVIELQAKNLTTLAEGKTPEIPVDTRTWDSVVKAVEIMPKFKLFESITNPEEVQEGESTGGNTFEERSKKIKAKINGSKED
jgi:hypothetical protein